MNNWETFCDESYYGLWRVRRVNFRSFESGFHVHNKEEAERLCELLNKLERERDEAMEERDDAKTSSHEWAVHATRRIRERDEAREPQDIDSMLP